MANARVDSSSLIKEDPDTANNKTMCPVIHAGYVSRNVCRVQQGNIDWTLLPWVPSRQVERKFYSQKFIDWL